MGLALAPDPALRDPARAVELADHACRLTKNADPNALHALATALAAAGRLEEAIATGERASRAAEASGRAALAREIDGEIAGYRSSAGTTAGAP